MVGLKKDAPLLTSAGNAEKSLLITVLYKQRAVNSPIFLFLEQQLFYA